MLIHQYFGLICSPLPNYQAEVRSMQLFELKCVTVAFAESFCMQRTLKCDKKKQKDHLICCWFSNTTSCELSVTAFYDELNKWHLLSFTGRSCSCNQLERGEITHNMLWWGGDLFRIRSLSSFQAVLISLYRVLSWSKTLQLKYQEEFKRERISQTETENLNHWKYRETSITAIKNPLISNLLNAAGSTLMMLVIISWMSSERSTVVVFLCPRQRFKVVCVVKHPPAISFMSFHGYNFLEPAADGIHFSHLRLARLTPWCDEWTPAIHGWIYTPELQRFFISAFPCNI